MAPHQPRRLELVSQQFLQKIAAERRKQAFDSGQIRESFNVLEVQLAQVGWLQVIAATGFEQWQVCQADLQVSLDGSDMCTELIC